MFLWETLLQLSFLVRRDTQSFRHNTCILWPNTSCLPRYVAAAVTAGKSAWRVELLSESQVGSVMNCLAVAAAACLLEVCATDGKNSGIKKGTPCRISARKPVLLCIRPRFRNSATPHQSRSLLTCPTLQYAVPQFPKFTIQDMLASEERQ